MALLWAIARYGASPFLRGTLRLGEASPSGPVRLRLALEHLGLTYVKLGQYLAMRFDILPPEVCRELGRLFEGVEPMPPADVSEMIRLGLGQWPEQLYASFSAVPIASASVGQVHEARTFDGMKVAVKVQRKGIERVLRADTSNLRALTRVVDAFHLLGALSATELLAQFTAWTFRELDFVLEGRTAEQVGEKTLEFEKIPRVRWDLTCPVVLTLEFVEGLSMAQIVAEVEAHGLDGLALSHPEIDVGTVLHNTTFAILSQIFVRGLFHGDPHPGNVLVQEGNTVAFVDFGIFGRLRPFDQDILSGQIENLAVGRIDESVRYYRAQLSATDDSDIEGFQREARHVLQTWYDTSVRPGASLKERHIGQYIGQMVDISRRYRMRYDMSYVLYWRALNALDSTSLQLSPSFDMVGELRQFFAEIRPGPMRRLLEAVTDFRALAPLAGFGATEAPMIADLLARTVRGWPLDVYSISSSAETDRTAGRRLRLLSGGLTSLSVLVLAVRLTTTATVRGITLAAAAAILALALIGTVRG
ncbi:MAG TPA: AarF/UbiB family protein [Acidimicrobiales bacterium]|nr:AarF/UbiB family protein [Acidimicrobiales bacterium]